MALNSRPIIDERWVYHHRTVAQGAMRAQVIIGHPTNAVVPWDPFSEDPEARVFATDQSISSVTHWVGPARVQPNKDWRARKERFPGQAAVDYAVRFQISLEDGTLPEMHTGDTIRVTNELPLPDPLLSRYLFVVRNISVSSNSWVRTILCDYVTSNVSA